MDEYEAKKQLQQRARLNVEVRELNAEIERIETEKHFQSFQLEDAVTELHSKLRSAQHLISTSPESVKTESSIPSICDAEG
jgi:paraquat-inducible protein B